VTETLSYLQLLFYAHSAVTSSVSRVTACVNIAALWWLLGSVVTPGLDQHSCPTPDPVSTWMGDR